ncbi:hypothetical protein HanRHA438_Chr04g0151421 [Helianthus annuus]|nr:hypothetical protein HanRHA438_Chr04g0151421 [Helianthus annuus]
MFYVCRMIQTKMKIMFYVFLKDKNKLSYIKVHSAIKETVSFSYIKLLKIRRFKKIIHCLVKKN